MFDREKMNKKTAVNRSINRNTQNDKNNFIFINAIIYCSRISFFLFK